MEFRIDRNSQVPLRVQIKGTIEYAIAFGGLAVGDPLPSVRELAESTGVAPMTISAVYRDLKDEGLIETRPGAGTFVADSSQARMAARPAVVAFHRQIDDLVDRAIELGLKPQDVGAMITARLNDRVNLGHRASLIMVGLFPEATASYSQYLSAYLGAQAEVGWMILSEMESDAALRARAASADLLLTFTPTHRAVMTLLPSAKVVPLRFIPSEQTRLSLAGIDPLARLLVVSRFPDFLPILKSGVQRFAPHVADLTDIVLEDERLQTLVDQAEVVIYSTGAERVRELAPPAVRTLEYRHAPDPGDIERLVIPFIQQVSAEASGQTPQKDRPLTRDVAS